MIGRRYRLSEKGLEAFPRMQKEGIVIGESRDGKCWMLLPDNRKTPHSMHKSFADVNCRNPEEIKWDEIRAAVTRQFPKTLEYLRVDEALK